MRERKTSEIKKSNMNQLIYLIYIHIYIKQKD